MTQATPIRGTVKMVERGTCTHCGRDILRNSPAVPWWHERTGFSHCRVEDR